MAAKLHEVKALLRKRRHWSIPEQGQWLGSVVRGHTAYYAVPGNIAAVSAFRLQVTRHWSNALRRRSQRHRLTWERMGRLEARWLPAARITHPWPNVRFDARHPRQEPSALVPLAGICPGGRPQGRSLPGMDEAARQWSRRTQTDVIHHLAKVMVAGSNPVFRSIVAGERRFQPFLQAGRRQGIGSEPTCSICSSNRGSPTTRGATRALSETSLVRRPFKAVTGSGISHCIAMPWDPIVVTKASLSNTAVRGQKKSPVLAS